MPRTYTRTYRANGEGTNAIEISIKYRPEGTDKVTGQCQRQGYYLVMQPVTRSRTGCEFRPFTGRKTLVLPCGNDSARYYARAKAMMDMLVSERMSEFCRRENIDVDDSEYEEREVEAFA